MIFDRKKAPRTRLISTRLGPPVEMARWLLEQRAIPYREEAHAPVFHALVSKRMGVKIQLPLVVTPEGPWAGIKEFIEGLDEKSRSGEKVFGEAKQERIKTRELIDHFCDHLFWPAVQLYYYYLLNRRDTVVKYALDRAPAWQKLFVRSLFPIWKWMMRSGLKLDGFSAKKTLAGIDRVFAEVEEATSDGSRYLGGNAPSAADIVFASLAGPLVLPGKFPAPLPDLNELPEEYRKIVEEFRSRPAGQLISRIYDKVRPEPQYIFNESMQDFKLARFFLRSRLIVRIARFLVRLRPYISFGNIVLVLSWRHVMEVLQRDGDFLIAPVNAKRINEVSGPFILGMDRSPELFVQREAVYSALRAADMAPARKILRKEAAGLLSAAKERHGCVDVVNGYSRLVAARTAVSIFGIRGPTEQDLIRVLRAIFQQTFLNLRDDPIVACRGAAAGKELAGWINTEISRRGSGSKYQTDVLAGLMRAQSELPLSQESVTWMLAGLLVGAVDTTATAIANISIVLLGDRRILANARGDIDDPQRMRGWCYEALRFRPHNPIFVRQAANDTRLGTKNIRKGAKVIAVTLSAMHDPAAFPHPASPLPTRPCNRYLHFGAGLHACAGRNFNAHQIPHLVTELLRAGASDVVTERARGPFPDEVVVRLEDA